MGMPYKMENALSQIKIVLPMNNVRKMSFVLRKHNTSMRALIIVQVAENATIVKETVLKIHSVKDTMLVYSSHNVRKGFYISLLTLFLVFLRDYYELDTI